MKIKTLLFLFAWFTTFSQSVEYLKKQDTLYLIMDTSDKPVTITKKTFTYRMYGTPTDNTYIFKPNGMEEISFQTSKKKQGLAKHNIKVKTKDFIRKNKGKIVDIDFIEKHGVVPFFIDVLGHPKKKIIYVIDKKDIKKRKTIIKRTLIFDLFYIEM